MTTPTARDPKQDEFMARDVCLLVDAEDRVVGTATKEQTHREALLHRAFSVLLFDPDSGKLLLQRRSRFKVTFPLLWANTCCSHPLDSALENTADRVLGVKRAAVRKLEHELGIAPEQLPLDGFVHVSHVNPNEVDAVQWVDQAALKTMLQNEPETLSPWFKIIAQSFLFSWWDSIMELLRRHSPPYPPAEVAEALHPFMRSDIPSLSLP